MRVTRRMQASLSNTSLNAGSNTERGSSPRIGSIKILYMDKLILVNLQELQDKITAELTDDSKELMPYEESIC